MILHEEWISKERAAAIYGITRRCLDRMINSDTFPNWAMKKMPNGRTLIWREWAEKCYPTHPGADKVQVEIVEE